MARNATYYEGDLRRDLMDAALQVIAEEGPAAVSMRALAKGLGVSHAAPANHFADKRALFTGLAIEGFDLLGQAFAAAARRLPEGAPAVESLRAGGRAYVAFALSHRAHFEVMWRADLHDPDDPTLESTSRSTLSFLTAAVSYAQAQGWARGGQPRMLAMTLWSAVHGFAVLWLDGPLPEEFVDDVEHLTDQLVDLTLRIGT